MNKRYLILLFIALFSLPAISQEAEEPQKPKAQFSGFFRFDYWYDSRQIVGALDGLLHLYPAAPSYDTNGDDINAAPSINGLAMATRLRTNVDMPKVFNAKSRILVEVDFTGTSNNTIVHTRFRHGFTRLTWESGTELDVGLTWHPMFVIEVFPYVANLNTGSPFQSFNRSPQITFKHNVTPSFRILLSALSQSDYKGFGPDGASTVYLRNAVVPNLHAQLIYTMNPVTAGVAIDYKSLRPRLFTTSITNPSETYITNERINSLSYMAFLKLQMGLFTAKFKGMLAQNMGDHLMLGGYGIAKINPETGKETYAPLTHLFLHTNITYGKTVMPGIFVGYAKNMGANENFANSTFYGRGFNIDYAYRVSPNFTYKIGTLSLMLEAEYTFASIGRNEKDKKGMVVDAEDVANVRALLMIQYDF